MGKLERSVLLCPDLPIFNREKQDGLWKQLLQHLAIHDWTQLDTKIEQILRNEGQLADFISFNLNFLAMMAQEAWSDNGYTKARAAVSQTREALAKERRRLIEGQKMVFDNI